MHNSKTNLRFKRPKKLAKPDILIYFYKLSNFLTHSHFIYQKLTMKSLIVFSTLMLFCSIGYTQQKNDAHVNADYFLFDKKGNKISAAYSYISEINEQGYAIFAKGGNYIEIPYGQIPNAKYGIIHESGKIIVPAQYDYLDPITTGDSIFITTLNEKNGLIHQNGTILLQPTYAQINTMYDVEGMLEARLSDNIYRLIDFNGKSLTKTYQSINSTNDGFIVQDQGYYGLINKIGRAHV